MKGFQRRFWIGSGLFVTALVMALSMWLERPAPPAERPVPASQPAASLPQAPESLSAPPQRDPDADPAAVAAHLNQTIGATFGEDQVAVAYDKGADDILISVRGGDMLGGAQAALSGDQATRTAWADMRQSLVSLCDRAREYAALSGLPDIDVVVNLLGEDDPEEILLTVRNGEVDYDAAQPDKNKPG